MSTRDHVKPALKQLHWLPVEQRISYKLCLLIHYCPLHSYWSGSTISEQVCLHDLFIREQVQTQIVWRHTAAYCREHAPSLANVVSTTPVRPHVTLPSDLHDITNTNVFKKRLKTVLFDRTYRLIVILRRPCTVRTRRFTNLSLL